MEYMKELSEMKRFFAIITVVMMCAALMVPAMAAQVFTPSVTNKPAPEIVPVLGADGEYHIGQIVDGEGDVVGYVNEDCLVITPVSEVDSSIDIPEASRTVLKSVYSKLQDGSMTIPYEKHNANLDISTMVVRDLFDASFVCSDCPAMLEPEGVVLEITFDLNVTPGVSVYAMTYKNDQWDPIVSTVNNGDGTVTATFEKLCPVEFSVGEVADVPGPGTGDQGNTALWAIIAISSLAAIVVLTVVYRVSSKKHA